MILGVALEEKDILNHPVVRHPLPTSLLGGCGSSLTSLMRLGVLQASKSGPSPPGESGVSQGPSAFFSPLLMVLGQHYGPLGILRQLDALQVKHKMILTTLSLNFSFS